MVTRTRFQSRPECTKKEWPTCSVVIFSDRGICPGFMGTVRKRSGIKPLALVDSQRAHTLVPTGSGAGNKRLRHDATRADSITHEKEFVIVRVPRGSEIFSFR